MIARKPVRLGVALLVIAAACGEPSVEGPTVTLGLLLPYTGGEAIAAVSLERGVITAVEAVNEAGGVAGRTVRIVAADTRSTVEGAREGLARLLEEQPIAIIGPDNAEIAREVLPVVTERGIVLISPYINDAVPHDQNSGTVWYRLAPKADDLGAAMAVHLITNRITEAAIVYTDETSGRTFGIAAAQRFRELGGTVTASLAIPPATSRYTDEVAKVDDAQFRRIMFAANPLAGSRFVLDLFIQRPRAQREWYLAPMLKTDMFVKNASARELESAHGVAPHLDEQSQEFVQHFQARWEGEVPYAWACFSYDAAMLLMLAIERASEKDEAGEEALPGYGPLVDAIRRTARPPGAYMAWNSTKQALDLLRAGTPVSYFGVTGPMQLEADGARRLGKAALWTIANGNILDR